MPIIAEIYTGKKRNCLPTIFISYTHAFESFRNIKMSTQEKESEGPPRKIARLEGDEDSSEVDPETEKEDDSSLSSDLAPCKLNYFQDCV